MISKKLFDQIQEALTTNGKPRKNKKQQPKAFEFLNFAVCGECGYSITAERHIKRSGLKFVYYRCTHKSKVKKCSEKSFLREEELKKQVKVICQKVSLPDVWKDRFLKRVSEWEKENNQTNSIFAQNLKDELSSLKTKIDRLTDGYLEGGFELSEFQEKKNKLMQEKKDLEERLSKLEQKGNKPLELTRNWDLEASEAQNLAEKETFLQMRNFLKTIGSNRFLRAKKLEIEFQNPWEFLFKMPEKARIESKESKDKIYNSWQNSLWWT